MAMSSNTFWLEQGGAGADGRSVRIDMPVHPDVAQELSLNLTTGGELFNECVNKVRRMRL